MKTETKKNRLEIYFILKNIYSKQSPSVFDTCATSEYENKYLDKPYYGLCGTIQSEFDMGIDDLPELMAQKPLYKNRWGKNREFWWSPFSVKMRLKAIDNAIKMCM